MTVTLRDYQQRTLDQLYNWWTKSAGNPLVTVPTGGGKSVIIAELCRLLFDTWPEDHPRTVVLVPSKELAQQNAEKLVARLPSHIKVGFYSASLGRKRPDADVIVATIGSIYKSAHLLGNIRCVVIDEAHLVNPEGAELGRFRQFLTDLAKYCQYRVVGYTATPFRGNGIFLTEGDDPLFHGVASHVTVQELLDNKFLAPLIRPIDAIKTRIDTDGIKTTSGDYNIGELSDRVEDYLPSAAAEACILAADRKKWIAFTVTVDNAKHLAALLEAKGISSAVVCGDTPKVEREALIQAFRIGEIRCLVTVLALATGFDVPDVDCILWLRPTKSPVLYVQGAGRGFRIADGKDDCLWLDFSDTTERLGPVDAVKGRRKPKKSADIDRSAPTKTCPNCGEQVAIALSECPTCGTEFVMEKEQEVRKASNAAIMSAQAIPKINTYKVDRVTYGLHRKEGKPDSMRVDYWSGLRVVFSEWVCFEHGGFAAEKAQQWWAKRRIEDDPYVPKTAIGALDYINKATEFFGYNPFANPVSVTLNESSKFPDLVKFTWKTDEPNPTHRHERSPAPVPATV